MWKSGPQAAEGSRRRKVGQSRLNGKDKRADLTRTLRLSEIEDGPNHMHLKIKKKTNMRVRQFQTNRVGQNDVQVVTR